MMTAGGPAPPLRRPGCDSAVLPVHWIMMFSGNPGESQVPPTVEQGWRRGEGKLSDKEVFPRADTLSALKQETLKPVPAAKEYPGNWKRPF